MTRHNHSLTRREFLKLGSIGLSLSLAGWVSPKHFSRLMNASPTRLPAEALKSLNLPQPLAPDQQGRVLDAFAHVYDQPSFNATRLNTYWRDQIIPLTGITLGSLEESHNIIWYRVGNEGYAHSGLIQPVRTLPNPVAAQIPPDGILAEVTVPYTDARWVQGFDQVVAYRFYFETTYWVTGIVQDNQGQPWYRIQDDKWDYSYYAPASHFHLFTPEEIAPISPQVPQVLKRIEVLIPEQVFIAYEMDVPVFMARVASGAVFSNGDFSTPLGRYITFHKRASRHMATGNLAANGYDLPGVPWNSYITEQGIAFHGTYWHNNFGKPRSHGCINLTPQAARWVYRWTLPAVPFKEQHAYENYGTAVDIFG